MFSIIHTADGWTLSPTHREVDGSQLFFSSALNAEAYRVQREAELRAECGLAVVVDEPDFDSFVPQASGFYGPRS